MITEKVARRIASEWHSGQWTELYAFSSSGNLLSTKAHALKEVEGCMMEVTSKKDLNNLVNLHKYINAKF